MPCLTLVFIHADGTCLAQLLGRNGCEVKMWVREAETIEAINIEHENTQFLKGCPLPKTVSATNDLAEAVGNGELT